MQVHETPLNRIWKHNYLVPVLLLVFADLFIIRDSAWLKDNGTGLRFIVNYLLALIGFLSLLYIIKNLLVYNRALKFLGLLVVGLPLVVQTSYFSVYRKFVTPFGFGFFTENVGLTFKLFFDHINIVKVFLSILFLIGSFYILYKRRSKVKKVLVTVHGILFLGVLAHSVFGWYTVTDFQFSVIGYYNSLADSMFRKTATFKLNKPEVTGIEKVPGKAYDNIILIIGEATNLGNMSLYGYSRNTTPSLVALEKEGKLVALKNAISVGNKTNLSVPYLLTGLEGPDPTGRFYRSPNIFDYAKALGYTTALISAQDFHWGHLDKILIDRNVDLFRDGSSFSSKVDVLKGADDMHVLEKGVLPFLDTVRTPFLLVIQMDGSHSPFSDHCPPEFKRFLPEESEDCLNAYDNTIVYTDIYLERLFTQARSRFPECWIFFTPDHGQNLGGKGGWYNDNYMRNVVHNPLVVFTPALHYETVLQNAEAPVSQIDIFATLMDIFNIRPIRPIDGWTLLAGIPQRRLRTCCEYMPTFHNNPTGVLFFSDGRYYKINFRKRYVLLADNKTYIKYKELDEDIRTYLDKRLKPSSDEIPNSKLPKSNK